MKKIGLGLIGLGYIGNAHLQNSQKLDNASLVAVSDLSRKALETAKAAGVKKTFTDYEQLLKDRDIDAVIVALPTHLHLQCARRAAEERKHVFIEKPIGRNATEAKEILSATDRNSVKLMIGYPLRFNEEFRNIKEEIKNGTLGDVETAHAAYMSSGPFFHRSQNYIPIPVPEWWFRKELTGGGALIDVGIHLINTLRWYLGEVQNIRSSLKYRFNMDVEDSATCLAKFESGTTAVIDAGWFSQEFLVKVDLFGSVKHITAGLGAYERSQSRLLNALSVLIKGESVRTRSLLAELQYFVDCLIQDLSPSPSGKDGLKDLEAIAMAYKNRIDLSSLESTS